MFLLLLKSGQLNKQKIILFNFPEVIIMWTKPSYEKIRLGFEITMCFKTR
jgi:coenzyme PQQ precursor peptide PqqA